MSDSQFHLLLQRGILREATPGTYYLFERERLGRARWVRIAVLWLVLFLLPILIVRLSR